MRRKRRHIVLVIVASMLLCTGLPVYAGPAEKEMPAHKNDDLTMDTGQNVNAEVLEVQYIEDFEGVEILEQIPRTISALEPATYGRNTDIGTKIDAGLSTEQRLLPRTRSVIDGRFTDYIDIPNSSVYYPVTLPGGYYLQLQLDMPNDANIDYDLYITDGNDNILDQAGYSPYINGGEGTVSEAVGYMIPSNVSQMSLKMYIVAAIGCSDTLPYTLHYSVSAPGEYDRDEPKEQVQDAGQLTFPAEGAMLTGRNIHSPIDNDWYKIVVPSDRYYDKLNLALYTDSVNACGLEVFTDVGGTYPALKKMPVNNGVLSVTTGTYYLRVTNAAALFDSDDIQEYQLLVWPTLKPDGIIITGLHGTEGLNYMVAYPGYAARFRTDRGPVQIIGVVYIELDNELYGLPDVDVTGQYHNPHWSQIGIPDFANRYAYGTTDAGGAFNVTVDLPVAYGGYMYETAISYQYRDSVTFTAKIDDYPSLADSRIAWQLGLSIYNG